MNPSFCPTCGSKLDDGAKFCADCGQPIKSMPTGPVTKPTIPTQPTQPPQMVPTPHPPTAPPVKSKAFPWLPIVILLVGVAAVAIVLLLVRGENPPAGEVLGGATPTPTATPEVIIATTGNQPPVGAGAYPGGASAGSVPPSGARPAQPGQPVTNGQDPNSAEMMAAKQPTEPPYEEYFEGRRACRFDVDPEDAIVTVNGKVLGKADDWDGVGGGQVFPFFAPDGTYRPGPYYVKLTLHGYRSAWVKIVGNPNAEDDCVSVNTELKEIDD